MAAAAAVVVVVVVVAAAVEACGARLTWSTMDSSGARQISATGSGRSDIADGHKRYTVPGRTLPARPRRCVADCPVIHASSSVATLPDAA